MALSTAHGVVEKPALRQLVLLMLLAAVAVHSDLHRVTELKLELQREAADREQVVAGEESRLP
jgi:hypothetical protein